MCLVTGLVQSRITNLCPTNLTIKYNNQIQHLRTALSKPVATLTSAHSSEVNIPFYQKKSKHLYSLQQGLLNKF